MADDMQVAVIGFGLAGSAFHAPFVAATDGLRVSAVVTGNAERRELAVAGYPGVIVVSTVDELLSGPDRPDLVVVASPNRYHVEHATAALRRGIPVVVDKPVAGSAAEVQRLAELAQAQGVMFTVFQNRRWDGDFRTVRELLDSGRLNGVTRFESRFERAGRPGARSSWKTSTDPLELAHILYDLGSHLIDQAILLFGSAEWVYAEACSPRAEVAVDEDATVLLRHAGGVRSLLRMSNAVQPAAPRFAVLGAGTGFRCWGLDPQEKASRAGIRPTEPGFGVFAEEQWGALVTADGVSAVPTRDGDYLGFWAMVAACLRGEGPPPVLPEESARLVATIDAALRSVRTGAPVIP